MPKLHEDMHGHTILNPLEPNEGLIIPAAKSKLKHSI